MIDADYNVIIFDLEKEKCLNEFNLVNQTVVFEPYSVKTESTSENLAEVAEKKAEKLQNIWEALAQARKEEYQSFRYNDDEGMLYALLKVEGQT